MGKSIKAQLASARTEEILRLAMPGPAAPISSFRQGNQGLELHTLRQRFTPYVVTHQLAAAETIKCAEALYSMQLNKVIHALDFDKVDSIVLQTLPDCLDLDVVHTLSSSVLQSIFADVQGDTGERQQYEKLLHMLIKAKESMEAFSTTGKVPSHGIEHFPNHETDLADIFHSSNKRPLDRDDGPVASSSAKHPRLTQQ